jgi:hypothetical protein
MVKTTPPKSAVFVLVTLGFAVALTACSHKKKLTYRELVDAQQETLKAYGKVPDKERIASLEKRVGAPHETAPESGTTGRWFGLSTPQDASVIDCYVLEVTHLDAAKSPGLSVQRTDMSRCK